MPCVNGSGSISRASRRFGTLGGGAGWYFRVFTKGRSCTRNPLPQPACDLDVSPPIVIATDPPQLTPVGETITILLSERVTGVQTGPNSCNVRVFRQDTSQVPGTVAFDGDRTITFTPSATYCAGPGVQSVTLTVGSNPLTEPLCPAIVDSCGRRLPLTNVLIPVVGCV